MRALKVFFQKLRHQARSNLCSEQYLASPSEVMQGLGLPPFNLVDKQGEMLRWNSPRARRQVLSALRIQVVWLASHLRGVAQTLYLPGRLPPVLAVDQTQAGTPSLCAAAANPAFSASAYACNAVHIIRCLRSGQNKELRQERFSSRGIVGKLRLSNAFHFSA